MITEVGFIGIASQLLVDLGSKTQAKNDMDGDGECVDDMSPSVGYFTFKVFRSEPE